MNDFGDHRCQVHGIALRPDGRCFMCERDRPPTSSSPPGVPRFELKERRQSPAVTVMLAMAFLATIGLTVLWALSPGSLSGLFR